MVLIATSTGSGYATRYVMEAWGSKTSPTPLDVEDAYRPLQLWRGFDMQFSKMDEDVFTLSWW
jgi:hypothetical protein